MAAPILRPLGAARSHAGGSESFVVVRAGSFLGAAYAPGDVLVCEGEARHGDAVVLVARGHGRPRMGLVRGRQLLGDAGERCLEARWRPAGRLVEVVPGAVRACATLPAGAPEPVDRPAQIRVVPFPEAKGRRDGQLSLFGAEAA